MRQKERLCNNPEPKYLGRTCEEQKLGPGIETESCNPDPCPGNFILIMLKTILKKKKQLKASAGFDQRDQFRDVHI